MRRREFITMLGGATVAWPLRARSAQDSKPHLAGFLRGIEAFGYIDGKTVRIEYRWANGQYDQLRPLAGDLAALQPAVIAAGGGAPSARAACA